MAMRDQPAWLAAAWRELGQREVGGAAANARIVAYFRDAGHSNVRSDETAWCAAFAGAMLVRGGVPGTGSLMARSYLDWGAPLSEARLGALAVLSRGSDPALGHVGFVAGETDSSLLLLGGNQSNSVTVEAFDRSRLLGLRWPLSYPEDLPSAVVPSGDGVFETALAHVLKMEGGYSDDPYDPGGPTNHGITLKVFADFNGRTLDAASRSGLTAELKSIRMEVVRSIYERRYWQPAQCAAMAPGLALMHFDAAVNHGVGTAIRSLQEAAQTSVDGEIGPLTRAAIAARDPVDILERYAAVRERRYRALPHFWRFGRGWLNRVAATRRAALALASRNNAMPAQTKPTTQNQGDTDMTETTAMTGEPKWWGHSLTVWGAIVTAMAAILPALGPLLGIEITGDMVRQLGTDVGAIAQAIAGVIGTLMTLAGRARAVQPLMRRDVRMRV